MSFRIPTHILLAAALSLGLGTAPAHAQIDFSDDPVPAFERLAEELAITFEPIAPDEVNERGLEGSLINGQVVDPRDFPGVLRMVTGGTCTAALIGPATILTAGHCILRDGRIRFRSGNKSVSGICETAPGYDPETYEQDWALCLLSREARGIAFESVDVEDRPQPGETLALTGYGCTFMGGPRDGRLRIGFSTVSEPPANWRLEPSAILTASSIVAGDAVLCPGDSGGPLFRAGDDPSGRRSIVGVNSRTTYELGYSVFSATGSAEGAAFIRSWAERHGQTICGLNRVLGCT